MRDFNITVRRTTWHMEDIEEYEKALEEKLKALHPHNHQREINKWN